MGCVCGTYGRRERFIQGFWLGDLNEGDRLEGAGVVGRIILNWIFRKWVVGAWIISIWFRIRTGGRHL
jgi:hypothetical protein